VTPILAVSAARSGAGKTRLLARLIPALARRGVRVAVLKHTHHDGPFDGRGKDTAVLVEAGAVAAAIEGPSGMALFGPPRGGARALAKLLPPADLVLAEGFKGEPLPRLEVYRKRLGGPFLCATDRRVVAVVSDVAPPRALPAFDPDDVEAIANFVVARLGLALTTPRRPRSRPPAPPRRGSGPSGGSAGSGVRRGDRPRASRAS
jgi:molybdopterin-guanine dinucleotide biosynthesis adapter protein